MTRTALILGATGRMGRNAAEAFRAAGWTVRSFDRAAGDITRSSEGADVIVNAWNPPYTAWRDEVPALTRMVIDAARHSGARVIVPGNVYVFGPDAPAVLTSSTPHAALNPLGRVRIEMEEAYRQSGVKTLVLRAGDFLDTEPSGNWFDRIMIGGVKKGRFTYPGDPDIAHAWAFLPDLARAMVGLADHEERLPEFADIPFEGYTLTGTEIARRLGRITGRPLRVSRMSWLSLRLARPVWPMARSLVEMSYLWRMPHRLDGSEVRELLPDFVPTDIDAGLARAIAHKVHPDQPVRAGGLAIRAE